MVYIKRLPYEIVDKITSYNTGMYVPFTKRNSIYLYKRRNSKATTIQKWYKKYKIEKDMPIMFYSDFSEKKIPKWYLIRVYMKFYSRMDIMEIPYYITKMKIKNETCENKKHLLRMKLFTWGGNKIYRRPYEVYKFLKEQKLVDIINSGW